MRRTSTRWDRQPDQASRNQLRQRQVIDAAGLCFATSGFHGASMAEIARVAGMSVGHIYHYFSGKDEIIAALVADNVSRLATMMRELESAADPLAEMLHSVPAWIAECLDPKGACLQLEIAAEASRNPVIAKVVRDAGKVTSGLVGKVLHMGRCKLGLPADDDIVLGRTHAVSALFEGLWVRSLHHRATEIPVIEQSMRLALRALLYG